ncbi:MAG: ABC transporter permease [Christensenellales bacterium]|jgi:putative aldouronate transport system permease protein
MSKTVTSVASSTGARSRLEAVRKGLKRTKYLQIMILPCLAYYIIFHYVPMYGVVIAFKDYSLRLGIMGSPWVGLKHFRSFFAYPFLWRLIRNTFILSLYSLIWGFPMPIIFALLLNEVRNVRYKKAVQTISYLPHFISTVSVVGMLVMILSPQSGIVNNILKAFGRESIYFFAESRWFRTVYVGSGIWQNIGWDAIIYIAALSAIDQELFEAAVIDGANRFQQMLYITIPSIRPTIAILLIMRMGGLMSGGGEKALLMQQPITYEVSDVISTYVYRRGLVEADFSFGAAVGLFNSAVNVFFIITANSIARRLGETSLW